VRGARVLDLYAGSGAVGLEAISRGAREVVFVESERGAVTLLRASVARLAAGRGRVLAISALDALVQLAAAGERFDLVFVDPPYGVPVDGAQLSALARVAMEGAVLAVERRRRALPLAGDGAWCSEAPRAYGQSELLVLHLEETDRGAVGAEDAPG
jgi:16S rRNA (guanine966-N2)-methyltransferase